jgi:hypothetical protein
MLIVEYTVDIERAHVLNTLQVIGQLFECLPKDEWSLLGPLPNNRPHTPTHHSRVPAEYAFAFKRGVNGRDPTPLKMKPTFCRDLNPIYPLLDNETLRAIKTLLEIQYLHELVVVLTDVRRRDVDLISTGFENPSMAGAVDFYPATGFIYRGKFFCLRYSYTSLPGDLCSVHAVVF